MSPSPKTLGHRALFGKGVPWDRLAERLAPYHREEAVLVLTSLSALLGSEEAASAAVQRALVGAFFLESAARVEPKVKAGAVVFHREQVLLALRLAITHCRGDGVTQPAGPAFFEGIARVLVAVTDHLAPPKAAPKRAAARETRERVMERLNRLIESEGLPAVDLRAECLRAHRLLFERGPKLAGRSGFGNLAGAFHERHGAPAEPSWAAALHLLAKTMDYTLATMHTRQPVVRIASDFRGSSLETRQVERLYSPFAMGLRRAEEEATHSLAEGAREPLRDLEALRRRPVIQLLEDTFAAADPVLLAEALTTDLGARLMACAEDKARARRWWTALVRDHAESLLPALSEPLLRADRQHRNGEGRERPIADWFHVRGPEAMLAWVVTAPLRRDFHDDEALWTSNGRMISALTHAAREATVTLEEWRAGRCQPGGKRPASVKVIHPVAIVEREVPLDAALVKLLAALFKEEGLLQDKIFAPLTLVSVGAIEALARLEKPPSLLSLLSKRAKSAQRTAPFSIFLEKQGLPASAGGTETAAAFDKLVKAMRKMLGVAA
ncbi:MAG: hypothetical protein HUU25_04625 [Candidatus Sumerlaeia bacterium]|nr:hypothetical protein [Candidatus Sumerlaeia bacterium]